MTDGTPIDVSPDDVLRMREQGALLVDCRTEEEWAHCRIDGAVLIPIDQLDRRLDELGPPTPDRPIIVYCHLGVRSHLAARFLRQLGHDAAVSMAGGIERWSLEIDPDVPRY